MDDDKRQQLRDYLLNKYGQDMDAAREMQNTSDLYTSLADAGSKLGYALAGTKAPDTSESLRQAYARNARPVEMAQADRKAKVDDYTVGQQLTKDDREDKAYDRAQEIQSDEDDPNSDISKAYQATAMKFTGGKAVPGLSATQLKQQMPLLEKAYQVDQGALARKDANAERSLHQQEINDRKNQDRQDHALKDTMAILESARGNPAVAQAQRDYYSAQKAESLMNMYGDPNKLSQAQVNLLTQEVSKIASGGVPSMHELEGLSPNTLQGKMSKVYSSLINEPTPANAAAFVKQYHDYTSALSKDAKKTIAEKYGRVLESRKAQLGDDNYATLKQQYLDPYQDDPQVSNTHGMVTVQAPDGSTMQVPSVSVPKYLQKGGKIVQ